MSKGIRILILAMVLTAASFGCYRRPLYFTDQEGMDVVVKVLWKAEVYPDGIKPNGVTMYIFRDGEFYKQYTTADVDSSTVQLEAGRYKLFMISQSPEEFGQMEFENMRDFENASVSVVETETKWYTRAENEELIANPEIMTVGVSDEFEISEAQVESYLLDVKTDKQVRYYTVRVPVYPKSIVSQYWVTIYSDNADVLRSVRARTSGMARTFELTQDKTGDEEGTQFITHWSLTMDDSEGRIGHLDGKITTFGFPRGESPSQMRDSTLNVSALLVDNKTVEDYVFNVGNKITSETPPKGYRALYRLIFGSVVAPAIHPPDVQPETETSGFDAKVSDWEEGERVDIDM